MKKFSRILGVGLTIAMLAGVLVVANPVSVSAGTLTPSSEFSPPTRPGADVYDVDVAANGTTVYAVANSGTADLVSNAVQTGIQLVVKSTNSGTSWSGVGTRINPADATVIGNLPATTVNVNNVAVAPDVADGSWVAIVATDNSTVPSLPIVYISTDGGVTWQSAGNPLGMTDITALAVSGPAGTASHTMAVTGVAGTPKVAIQEFGGLFGGWVDATVGTGVPTGTWNALDFNSSTAGIWDIKFSPNYASDRTFVIVSANATGTQLQYANTNSRVWNGVLYGLGTGATAGVAIVSAGNVPTGPTVDAALALAPTFFGQDAASRVGYVSVATTAAPAPNNGLGGLFRASNVVVTRLAPGNLHSVALNKAGDKLVAGSYDTNDVVRVAAPATATVDTGLSATTNKRPALDYAAENEHVVVGFAGTAVLAGSRGTQSAFSRSGDDGKSFNDVSLIDSSSTAFPLLQRDFAVSADGSKIYVTTYDNSGAAAVVAVWRKTTAWERVLVMFPVAGTTDYILNVAPENGDVVFLAERNSLAAAQIYYTNDGGQTTWQLRIATRIFTDMAVESATTLYGLAGNAIVKSSDSGFLWDVNPVQNLAFVGANINVISAGSAIVGGTGGQVAYSVNGTWTTVGPPVPGFGTTFVAASGLASGNFIYAVTSASTEVYRFTVGGAAWTAMMEPGSLTGTPTGLAYAGGTLYVVTDAVAGGPVDPNTGYSDITRLFRVLTPNTTTKFEDWSRIKMIDTTSPGYSTAAPATIRLLPYLGANLGFVAGRNGLATTVGADGNPKLWGISYGHSNPVAPGVVGIAIQLTSFVDVLNKTAPAVTGPADASLVQLNTQTGKASSVVFTWTAPAGVPPTGTYNLQIALDSNFNQIVFGAPGGGYIPIQGTTFIIGPDNPNSPTTGNFPFQADTSYYWRVRVATLGGPETLVVGGFIQPYYSTSGTARSFKIGALAPLGIQAPMPGTTGVSSKPTFVWSPVQGATTYEIVVSDDPTFKIITFSRTTDRPNFASDEQLAYGTVYYWRVRASAPATAVTPFANGIFTTEAKPGATATGTPTATQPAITVTNVTPTITVELPAPVQAIPQFLLWIIIGIGAILVIALIVLIVRTRRVS
jgi:hypothetical protein